MYNIKEIKAIPIADVARKYGIDLEKKHGRLWGKLRNENTASFSINLTKNLWYDFGAGKGGSVIDLVAELENISSTEAINKLAEDFNIKNETSKGWSPLTDSQYRELGIQPERATLNFNFDLRVHTPEQLSRWNQKYAMPLYELAEKLPDKYNELVSKVGMKHVNLLRDAYFAKVKLSSDPAYDAGQQAVYKGWANKDAREINALVDLLFKAIKTNMPISRDIHDPLLKKVIMLKVNPASDMQKNFEQKAKGSLSLNEDEKLRNRVVKTYKSLFNFNQADYLTVDTVKALVSLNSAISNSENKFLTVQKIRELYKMLGNNLQNFEAMYSQVVKEGEKIPPGEVERYKEWQLKSENMKTDIVNVRDLFKICSAVIEGLREAQLAYKNDIARHNSADKSLEKSIDRNVELAK